MSHLRRATPCTFGFGLLACFERSIGIGTVANFHYNRGHVGLGSDVDGDERGEQD
ncbi:hypothetical protein [Nannocystis pusilla]|uniref:hypothetical protein n=1 Tax=Nannocystis pusilla TaxID=889268 RepID=UPI003B7F402B